jgi:hypothetical protein
LLNFNRNSSLHLLGVPLPNDEEISNYGVAYEYDWVRQHQDEPYKMKKKYAKMKKQMNKLTKKNRVVKGK